MRRLTHHSLQQQLYTSNHTRYSSPLYPFLIFFFFLYALLPPSFPSLLLSSWKHSKYAIYHAVHLLFYLSLPLPSNYLVFDREEDQQMQAVLYPFRSSLLSFCIFSLLLALIISPHHLIPSFVFLLYFLHFLFDFSFFC